MKEYLNQFMRIIATISLAIIMQACGGSSDKKTENYSISADVSSINFSNELLQESQDSISVNVTFSGNGLLLGYAPDTQAVGWLNFSTENVTATSATVVVKLINADNIAPDQYNTKLRISTGDVGQVNLVHHDIDVSLLIWQLTTNTELMSFGATLGDTQIASQTLSITSESDNEWSASVNVPWLSLDTLNGQGTSDIVVSTTLDDLTQAQLYQAEITLTESTSGDSKVVPVELGLDRHYVYATHPGVSLTKLANIETTSAILAIDSNSPTPTNWLASTNASWLTLTQNGDGNLTIALTDNVSVADDLYTAQITVNAVDANNNVDTSIESEIINVSYYQSGAAADNIVVDDVSINGNGLVTSPYLPYFYAAQENHLNTYHVYTGELINSIVVSPEGTDLERLLIDPNGSTIIARAQEDVANEDETVSTITHRYSIDLPSSTVTLIENSNLEYEPMSYISIKGREFIITQALEVANTALMRVFWDQANAYFTTLIDQAKTSQTIYAVDLIDSTVKRYISEVNDFTQSKMTLIETHQYRPELLPVSSAIQSFVVDDNDAGLYTQAATSEWISFNGTLFTDNGPLPQQENNINLSVLKSNDNKSHFVRYDPIVGFIIDIYNDDQSLASTVVTEGAQPSSALVSSDNARVIIHSALATQFELVNLQ